MGAARERPGGGPWSLTAVGVLLLCLATAGCTASPLSAASAPAGAVTPSGVPTDASALPSPSESPSPAAAASATSSPTPTGASSAPATPSVVTTTVTATPSPVPLPGPKCDEATIRRAVDGTSFPLLRIENATYYYDTFTVVGCRGSYALVESSHRGSSTATYWFLAAGDKGWKVIGTEGVRASTPATEPLTTRGELDAMTSGRSKEFLDAVGPVAGVRPVV